MCLLIATIGNARPSKKALRRAAVNNPDGFGFAVITGDKIHTYRSMDINDTIKQYFAVRDEHPTSPSIFHLRITTHGETNIDNCHPFRVNDNVVMGHNGMLPIKEEDGKSDTRIFAEEWLPEFDLEDLLDTEEGVQELEKFIGFSKLAFLNTSSLLKRSLYIINEDLGHWDSGVWYSNNSYKKSYGTWTPGTYTYDSSHGTVRYTPTDNPYADRPIKGWDEVWNEEECRWDNIDDDDEFQEWTCSACDTTWLVNLYEDDPQYCGDCGTCWYCERPYMECPCPSNLEL
jgi:predicted glutamine amidotransferase